MRNHDRGYPARGIEESFLARGYEEWTLWLADKALQHVPRRESGSTKDRDHYLCGMRHGFNLHRSVAISKPDAPAGGVGGRVKACDEEIGRLLEHTRPLGRDFA
jgi:hypothetical protein